MAPPHPGPVALTPALALALALTLALTLTLPLSRYRWSRSSFGFSSHPDLWLWLADAGIKQRGVEERPDDRLSWNLDSRSTGGWRAGRVYDLGASTEWVKRVYYR